MAHYVFGRLQRPLVFARSSNGLGARIRGLYHGGCTTGITQVNDTDLHAAFEREYQVCEGETFFQQNLVEPGNIGRTRQQVIDDAVSVWLGLDHSQGVAGHKRTGLSACLSGADDHILNRDAKLFWDEIGFAQVRDEAVAAVREAFCCGQLRWSEGDVDALREPFPGDDIGELQEGQEAEGELEEGEALWDDDDDDEGDERLSSGDEGEGSRAGALALCSTDLPIVPADTPEEISEAQDFASRMGGLELVKQTAQAANLPAAVFHTDRAIRRLRKAHYIGSDKGQPSQLLSRFVRKRREEEDRKLQEVRAESRKRNAERVVARDAERKLRVAKARAKAASAAKKEALTKCAREFSAEMCGQGHKMGGSRAHHANRQMALERLRLRSPPLPLELEARWVSFKVRYSQRLAFQHKAAVGVTLLQIIRRVMNALGAHLLDADGVRVWNE